VKLNLGDLRKLLAVGALVLVLFSVGNVLTRSGWLRDEAGRLDWQQVAFGLAVALPSLLNIAIGLSWNGWLWGVGVLLALVSWLPFLGDAGDLSCTDCAFALLLPITIGLPLVLLLVVRIIVHKTGERPS